MIESGLESAGTKAAVISEEQHYGLRHHVLTPMETLAQSISLIAPSTTPPLTVPLVFALAGVGTCLAYGIAMAAIVLVAVCIAVFAQDSSSPGSLYVYTRESMPPAFAAVSAYALFFAYVMTASSVLGGFLNNVYVLRPSWTHGVSPVLITAASAACAVAVAYREVRISARVMLWIEGVSVLLIAFVVALTLIQQGAHLDWRQIHLRGTSASSVRLGVMLAIFSFVGFESATTLGAEARDPLRTIPRAVILSAALAGVFFIVCSYGEVLGFAGSAQSLGESTAPFRTLSQRAGVGAIGPVIDAGVLVSMFAATLACVIAAARVLLLMAHAGLVSGRLMKTNAKHGSPARGSFVAGVLAFVPVAVMVHRGVSGGDVYGYMGTLAVFGFLTAYGLVAVSMMLYLKRRGLLSPGKLWLAAAALLAMVGALLGTLFPVPPAPYRYFPYVYAAYLFLGMGWYGVVRGRVRQASVR